jgi:glycosyltransferase XagB
MNTFLLIISILSIFQSLYSIYIMIWAWNDRNNIDNIKPPQDIHPPKTTFSIILPAWKEEFFDQTIKSVSQFNYPKSLYEVLIPLRVEDKETILLATKALAEIKNKKFKIILVSDKTRNKPNQLNRALQVAKGEVVTIFDSEDDPSKDLLMIVNSVFINKKPDIVQSNVQLINYVDKWFSMLNCMEYYFWFKSSLNYFANNDIMPLAGNTVFLNTALVKSVGGWNEKCLTEDGELGLRLATRNAKFEVIYDAKHATLEETPPTTSQFIKQRTRWVQGFFHIFLKGKWTKLNSLKKKLIFIYILLWPVLQSFFIFNLIFVMVVSAFIKLDLVVSIISIIPFMLLLIQMLTINYGIASFTKEYKLKYHWYLPILVILTFIPYQMILTYSALRAGFRELTNQTNWEKTIHINAHRQKTEI